MDAEQRKDWDLMLNAPLPGRAKKAAVKPTEADIAEDMAMFLNAQKVLG